MKGWKECTVCEGEGSIADDLTGKRLAVCEVSPERSEEQSLIAALRVEKSSLENEYRIILDCHNARQIEIQKLRAQLAEGNIACANPDKSKPAWVYVLNKYFK